MTQLKTVSSAPPKPVILSASRLETFTTCSQLYAAKYIHRIPDPGNDGAHRGSVCHNVLELLLKLRHKPIADAALRHQSCKEVPALWKLIRRFARKFHVDDPVNLHMIDGFILVALSHEFRGPPGTVQTFAERKFEIEVNEEDGRRYHVRGAIDQTFIVKDKHGQLADIRDFKGSKQKFEGEKAEFNTQSLMYQLVVKRLHPEIKRRRFRFLFMKDKKNPWQESPPVTDEQLYGFEWMLTNAQEALEAFTLDNASDNLAAFNENSWLCGVPDMVKKDGSPRWCCAAHKPFDFWVIVDGQGEHVASAFTEDELTQKIAKADEKEAKAGWRIEVRRYGGCPAHWNADGRRRNWQS